MFEKLKEDLPLSWRLPAKSAEIQMYTTLSNGDVYMSINIPKEICDRLWWAKRSVKISVRIGTGKHYGLLKLSNDGDYTLSFNPSDPTGWVSFRASKWLVMQKTPDTAVKHTIDNDSLIITIPEGWIL